MEGFYRQKHKENLYSFLDGPKHKENPFSFVVSIFRRGVYSPQWCLFSAVVSILWHNRGGSQNYVYVLVSTKERLSVYVDIWFFFFGGVAGGGGELNRISMSTWIMNSP